MLKELDAKAKVALDLLGQGAEEVSIIGTDIKVVRSKTKPSSESSGISNTQINIINQANAYASVNVSACFSILRQELKKEFEQNDQFVELEERINQIENELKKNSPDKSTLKNLLHWVLDFDWAVFIKIMVAILGSIS